MEHKKGYKYERVIIKLDIVLGSGLTAYDLINNVHKNMIYKLKKEMKITEFITIDASDFYIEIPKVFYSRVFYGIRKKMGDREFFRRFKMYSNHSDNVRYRFICFSGVRYDSRSIWVKEDYIKHVGLI